MSAALVLPWVWGFAEPQVAELQSAGPQLVEPLSVEPEHPQLVEPPRPARPQMAFYRKYTEALLRRYVRMSMEAGKVPSLLGKEMFRGHVTSYRVESFEDVVNALETRDEMEEVQMQTELLKAGVLTIDEVRSMRGLPNLVTAEVA